MPGILDQLAGLDTAAGELARDTFENPPLAGEMPIDTVKRQQNDALIAERQKIKDERAQRMTGLDFASRSIPTYSENGQVKPVTDSTGAPLTQLDKSNSIAWDSLGEAKKIVYGAKGPPVLSDPFETASDEIDKKGNTYKVTPGLPWKWTGTDADTVADSEQKTREIAVRKAASAVGGKLTLDQRAATVAATDYKRLGKEFDKLSNRVGIIPESEIGASIYSGIENNDPVAAKTAIESHFKTLYDAPDANKTAGFFSSDLSPEAKARRKQIDTDKALTNTAIDRMLATRSQHSNAQARMNATRAQADALAIERANAALVAAGMPPMAESGNYREGYEVPQQEQSDVMGSPVNEAVGAEDQADPSKKKSDLTPAIPGVKKPKPFFGISDTISGIWDAVSGLGTTAPQAFYQLVEGMERPDKYSPEAKAAFEKARIRSEAMAAKTAARQASGESTSVGESFREAGDSLGFSLGTMAAAAPAIYAGTAAGAKIGAGAALVAGVAGPQAAAPEEIVTVPVGSALGGTIGGIAAGMAASGGAAYRMAGASFLGESFKVLEENSVAKNGRAMTEEEKQIAFELLLPIAKNTAIWEAGPEAVGNAVTFGFGKIALGIGEPALKSLSKTVLGRLGVRAAAGAGVVGTELATETITQIEQEADQRKAAAIAAGQSPDTQIADYSSEGVVKSFKEVAPQTLALLGLMGGGTAAIKSVLPKSKDTKTPPPGTDASEDTTTPPPEPAPNGKISSAGMLSRAEKHLAGIEEEIARQENVAEKEITVPNGSGGYDKVSNPNYGFVDQRKLANMKEERDTLANLLAAGDVEGIAWSYGFEIGPPGSAAAPLDATPPAGTPSEELAGLLQKSMTGGALTEAEQTRFKELQAQVAARPTSAQPPPLPTAAPTAATLESNRKLSGWPAQWALATTASAEGVDLTKLSREEYADYAVSKGLKIDDVQLRRRPSLRMAKNETEYNGLKNKLAAITPEQKKSAKDFNTFAEEVKRQSKVSAIVSPGISVRGATANSSSWLFWKINKGASSDQNATIHKAYAGFSDIFKLTPDRVKAFLVHLQSKGFNGGVKTVQKPESMRDFADQIVMHGATEADAKLALAEVKAFFGDELNFTDVGIDRDGKSHSQVLADRIKQGVDNLVAPVPVVKAKTTTQPSPLPTATPPTAPPAAAPPVATPAPRTAVSIKDMIERFPDGFPSVAELEKMAKDLGIDPEVKVKRGSPEAVAKAKASGESTADDFIQVQLMERIIQAERAGAVAKPTPAAPTRPAPLAEPSGQPSSASQATPEYQYASKASQDWWEKQDALLAKRDAIQADESTIGSPERKAIRDELKAHGELIYTEEGHALGLGNRRINKNNPLEKVNVTSSQYSTFGQDDITGWKFDGEWKTSESGKQFRSVISPNGKDRGVVWKDTLHPLENAALEKNNSNTSVAQEPAASAPKAAAETEPLPSLETIQKDIKAWEERRGYAASGKKAENRPTMPASAATIGEGVMIQSDVYKSEGKITILGPAEIRGTQIVWPALFGNTQRSGYIQAKQISKIVSRRSPKVAPTPVTQLPETPVTKNTDAAIPAAAGQLETDGGKAAVKVRKWLNDQFKAGNKIGRYASALDNLNKKELDPDISNTLTQLLREVGIEDAPLSFEGKVYDDFWLDFSNAYNAPLTETIDKPAAKAQPKINEKPETPPETDGEDGQGQPPVLSGEQPVDQLLAAHAGVPSGLRAVDVEVQEKEDLDGPLKVAIVNGKPVIQYNPAILQLVKEKLDSESKDFSEWIKAAVIEEHAHVRFFIAVGAQWEAKGKAIFNALTKPQKQLLKDAYGEPGSSDFQHGGEYVRMLFQLRSGVPVTEIFSRPAEMEALYPVLEGPQSAVVEEILRQMQTIVGANPASVDDAPTKTKTPNEIALDKAADDLADGLFAGDPTRVELSLSTEATQDQFRKFLARAAQRTEDESVAAAILEEMEENDISPQSVTERFKESTYDNLPEPIQKRFQRMIKSVVGLQPGDVIYTKEEDDGSITLGEAKSWKDVIDVIDAGDEARYLQGTERGLIVMMHLANKGAGQMKQATGSKVEGMKTLGAGNPAASEQQPIPPEKAGQLVAFASAMLATNIRSPEAVAKYLEEKFKGKARSYTRAIWEMMGAIGGERGEQNWNNIYKGLGTTEKPEAIAGTVAERVRDMLLRGEKLNRRTLTAMTEDGMDAKELDEQAELGVVMAGREIAKTGASPSEIYDQLLDLYERQPNFTAKTSTSKINQAYSTPIPLAYLGSHIAQISQNTILQESTAGNGALAIEANPNTALINEIDPTRAANLRLQGFTVSSEDATKWTPTQKADRLHINPPFGTILNDDGTLQQWTVDGLTTNQVDHAIVIKSLGNLKNDGRAVLIIGGTQAVDRDERRSHYGNGNRADFFKKLYAEYGVIDHFTVNGSLYEKQGAGWPVDVIVIAGRKPSPIQLPNVNPPRILNTWAEVKSELTRTDEERIKAGQYNETRDREELGGNINAIRDALNRRKRLGRTGDLSESPVETDIETGDIGVGDNVGTVSTTDLDGGIPEDSEGGEIGVGDGTIADGTSVGGRLLKEQAKTDEAKSAFHKPYVPVATGKSFGIETPANLAEPQRTALEAIEREVGKPLLEYVREKVGYDAKADMGKYFAAEQIDAIASAIYNIENNGALILGDMAGVGKGRVIAALIEYAKRNDLIPIFVTKNATLYSAMLGDFQNIGRTISPLYTNSLLNFDNPVTGETIKTGNQKSLMNQIERDAKLPDGFDAIFTTYDQIGKDVDPTESAASRALAKSRNQPPRPGPRTRALESLTARRKTLVMMDESHLGAGASIQGMRLRKILTSPNLRAYYSSATFAKRADAMPLYFKTNLRKAAGSAEELLAVFESGGVVMQQVASSMLAKDGQYIRRERSFEGIPFETRINTNTESRDRKLANEYTRGLRGILDMSNRIDEATKSMNKIMARIGRRMNVPTIKIEGAEFASQIHNFVKQYLFAIKAEAAAEQAIKAIKEGYKTKDGTVKKHKVIIAVENTMEGPIKNLDAQGQSLDFTNLLLNTLNGLRKIKTGGTERSGTATYFTINRDPQPEFLRMSQGELEDRLVRVVAQTDSSGATTQVGVVNEPVAEELFRRLANSQFIEAEDEIKGLELGGMPLSPIDYIRQKAEAAGIRTGEITGRSMGIDSEGNTYPRDPKDISKRGQLEILNQFNNTDLDLMIINASGSTGISAHADENFDNLAPRMMIIAQPHLDINEFVQTLGRIFRSGQVEDPRYMLLQTALPAEKRPAAITAGKMASLNANTTSNVDNEVSEAGNSVDIFNEYGDAVVWRFLADNPQFVTGLQYKKITSPTGVLLPIADILERMQEDGKFARNVANYGGLLEVEMQDLFWEDVVNRYNAQIAYLDQLGENKLKAGAEDLGAETLDSAIWTSGDPTGKSNFDKPSFLETVAVRPKTPPMEPSEVMNLAKEAAKTKSATLADYRKASLKFQEDYLKARKAKTLGDWSMQEPRERQRLREQFSEVWAQINRLGNPVKIVTKGGQKVGAIIGFEIDPEHPLTPSKQIFIVANNTLKRTFKIPASQMAERVLDMDSTDFEEQYNETREDKANRYIITGNLVAASAKINSKMLTVLSGAVTVYTKSDGTVATGIMMPGSFNPNAKETVRVTTSQEIERALNEKKRISGDDGKLAIVRRSGKDYLEIPASKSGGGKYWQDQELNRAMEGRRFGEVGSLMRGEIANMAAVVQKLQSIGVVLTAPITQSSGGPTLGAGNPAQQRRTEDRISDYSDERLARQIPTNAVQREWIKRGVFPANLVYVPTPKEQRDIARLVKVIRNNSYNETGTKASNKVLDAVMDMPLDEKPFIKIGADIYEADGMMIAGNASKVKSFANLKEESANTPQMLAAGNPATPRAQAYSKEAIQSAFNLTSEQAEATDILVKSIGLDESKITVSKGGTAKPDALLQMEDVLSGKEKVPNYDTIAKVVEFIRKYAKTNQVIPKGINLMSSKGRASAVDSIVKHTLLELGEWKKITKNYIPFYTADILERTNPALQKYALEKYGRKLSKSEIAFIHLLSAFGSGQAEPTVDTITGMRVFDEYMRTGRATGYSDKPKPVYKAPAVGESPKRVFIDSKTGEDTFNAKGNSAKFDNTKKAQISKTYNVSGLARFNRVLDYFNGNLDKTIEWLGSQHKFSDIRAVIGDAAADSLKPHEYLNKNGLTFGTFVLGNNPKLGSYILNRWQNLGTITKDMWVARTMSRYFREPNTGEPWGTTVEGNNKRRILDEAWGLVAEKLGVEPAQVQEMMWDAEKKIYSRFGQASEGTYTSQGVEMEIARRAKDVAKGMVAESEEGTGVLQRGSKGAFEFAKDGKSLIRGFKDADVSTGLHEIAHVVRRQLFDRNLLPEQRAGITDADIAITEAWAGVDGMKGWDRLADEKFARGFERYMRDGKAPAENLQPIFAKFKKWMTEVYRKLIGSKIDVKISSAMRQVFDKLVTRSERLKEPTTTSPQTLGAGNPANADDIERANKTARTSGAIGGKAITPRYVAETVKPGETVLNFGAGKPEKESGKYAHSELVKSKGAKVSEYDFGANSTGVLGKKYNTVFASNVLNVQSGEPMLRNTLEQIKGSVEENGRAVFNYPDSPRYSDITPDAMANVIGEVFGERPVRVGGTKSAPLWSVGNTKTLGAGNPARSGAATPRVTLYTARHATLEAKYNAMTITPEETAEAQRIVDASAKEAGAYTNDDGKVQIFIRGGNEKGKAVFPNSSFWTMATKAGQKVAEGYRDEAGDFLGRNIPDAPRKERNQMIFEMYRTLPETVKRAYALSAALKANGRSGAGERYYNENYEQTFNRKLKEAINLATEEGFKPEITQALKDGDWNRVLELSEPSVYFAFEVSPIGMTNSEVDDQLGSREQRNLYKALTSRANYFAPFKSITRAYLMFTNPLRFKGTGNVTPEVVEKARADGYDVIWSEGAIGGASLGADNRVPEVVVLSASQVKSAEPFTGTPLSERFNPDSDSILKAGNPARPAQGNLPITSAPSQTTSSNIPPLPPGSFVQLPSQPTPPNTAPGRIDSVFRRILSGGRWFWEGTADVLERAGYAKLAKAIKYQFDVEAREFGEMWKPIRNVLEKHPAKIIDAAKKEFADYFQNRENGRDAYAATQLTGYSAAGQELIAAWKKAAVETGLRLTNLGVEVQNPDGSWRPIGNLGEKFFPRKINQATMKILEEPEKYPVEWKALVDALIANGNIATTAEAEAFLKEHVFYETSKSDYFATIERARTGKLPESWLEYKFDEIAPWYVTHYARRSGQIEAYGQEHKGGDLFDKTLAAMPKRKPWSATQAYVKAAKDAAYMRRDNTQLAQSLRNLQTLATGTFLTNPFSSIRNVVSGVTQSGVLFGPINTLKASWKVLNAMREKLDLANELGVLRDDMMQMMVETRLVDETTGAQALRKVSNLGLTISGFNLAERFARMVALTVASDFARSYRTATGAKKDQMTAFLIRNDANPALIFAGDKKETNSFIRNSVAQGQGSYKFPQTPLYFAEPKVAFLMQFGKWGTQMTRTLTKHAINPAVFGTTVNGKQVRTFMPLLYAVAFAIGGGELLYLIRDLFTDRDRPDASIEEINKALTQNEQEGIQQIANRVFSDIIMAGTLGMFSDYAGNLREFATRNRFKNPFDPAGVQAFKNVFTVLATLKQQRTLTSKDIKDAFETQFSGAKFLDQTVRNITGNKKQEALQAQTEARQAGMRMAKELGMPVQSTFTSSMPVKSPKTPYYTALNDALLTGDVSAARKAVSEFSASLPPAERSKAVKSLGSSVNQKAPIKVGGIAGATQRADFMKWAGKRLPEAQFRRITELDATYWRTAIRAGVVDRVPQSTKSSFVVPLTRNPTGTSTFDNL